MSDLHFETRPGPLWRPDAVAVHDVIVLAGDIHRDTISAASWATWSFSKPVVYVAGNHEFYGSTIEAEIENSQAINETHDGRVRNPIHFLENASVVIAGVRFLGCTLWTDFELHGSDRTAVAFAMRDAVRGVPDYQMIRNFMPSDARARHLSSRAWLEQQLAMPFDGPTVVVTHHAPSPQSIGWLWRGATTSPAYASDLEQLIQRWQPALWVHGHVHDSFDYMIGRTRIVCNPRGFGDGGPDFNPALVFEL